MSVLSTERTSERGLQLDTEVAEILNRHPAVGLGVGMVRDGRLEFTAPASRQALEASCPTLLVAGEKEATVRASNAALAALMPHAAARFVPGHGHAWFGWRPDLHVRMVEAWLTGEVLPEEPKREPPSPSAVDRVLRRLDEQRRRRP